MGIIILVKSIQRQLKLAGVQVTIELIDISSPNSGFVQNVLQPRDFDLLLHELPIGADPDVYPYWHSSQISMAGYNFANYSNKLSDLAISSARDSLNAKLRNKKYIAFAKQWLKDVPAIGLYQQTLPYASNKQSQSIDDGVLVDPASRFSNVNRWSVTGEAVYKTP